MACNLDGNVTFYGFTPVPRDPEVLFKDHPTYGKKQDPFTVDDFPLPTSALVTDVTSFVKAKNIAL